MKWQAVVSLLVSFTLIHTEVPSLMLQHDKTIEAIYQYVGDEPKTLCKSKLEEIITNPKTSIPFFDAIGKPASGILLGNLNWWGNYDLCMQLNTAGLKPCKTSGMVPFSNTTSVMLMWTSCLPSDCKDEFVDFILSYLSETVTPLVDKYVPSEEYSIVHDIIGLLGWKPVQRDILIDFDLETTSLQIKTNSTLLSKGHEKLIVNFYDEFDNISGYFAINFKTIAEYKIGNCGEFKDFIKPLPLVKDRIWNITKTSGPGIIVTCNGNTYLDLTLSDEICSDTNTWRSYWSKSVAKIKFSSNDTASDKYYVKPEHGLTTTCQQTISYDAGAYVATILCVMFIILTVLGSVRGPLKNYIGWFAAEFIQCGDQINASEKTEVVWNKESTKMDTSQASDLGSNIVIGNKTADAKILLDVQASCQTDVTEDDARAGFEVAENLYAVGEDPEEFEQQGDESLMGVRTALCRVYPGVKRNEVLDKISKTTVSVLKCFSLQRNLQILLDTSVKPGQVLCMNGIRSLSIGWVVLSHMFLVPLLYSQGDGYQALTIGKRRSFDIILNGFPSVDSFFVMSGFLVSYLLIKNFENGKTFQRIAFGYYIHRYIRLTVPYLMVILVQAFLYRQFISGPFDHNLVAGYEGCKDWWWSNILYINNFVPWSQPAKCVGQSWYLANDMQFFVIAPIFICALWKSPLLGNLLLWGSVLLSMIAAAISTWHYKFASSPLRAGVYGNEFVYYYTKPYFRCVPYFVGIFGGWLYHKYGKKMEQMASLKPLTKVVLGVQLWILTIAVEYGVVFGTHNDAGIAPVVEAQSITIPYAIFNRLGWSAALLTQIFMCQAGLGGPINSFLSWKGWLPLSRLTYSVYLLHYGIDIAWVSQMRHVYSYSPDFQSVVIFLGLIVAVNFCGVLLFLLVEQPSANLEKLLLPGPPPPRTKTLHHDPAEKTGKVPVGNGKVPAGNGKVSVGNGKVPAENGKLPNGSEGVSEKGGFYPGLNENDDQPEIRRRSNGADPEKGTLE